MLAFKLRFMYKKTTYIASADIISLCIDLLRSRVDWLKSEQTHTLVVNVLVPLIEKSNSVKVMQAIVGLAHDIFISASKVDAYL